MTPWASRKASGPGSHEILKTRSNRIASAAANASSAIQAPTLVVFILSTSPSPRLITLCHRHHDDEACSILPEGTEADRPLFTGGRDRRLRLLLRADRAGPENGRACRRGRRADEQGAHEPEGGPREGRAHPRRRCEDDGLHGGPRRILKDERGVREALPQRPPRAKHRSGGGFAEGFESRDRRDSGQALF